MQRHHGLIKGNNVYQVTCGNAVNMRGEGITIWIVIILLQKPDKLDLRYMLVQHGQGFTPLHIILLEDSGHDVEPTSYER